MPVHGFNQDQSSNSVSHQLWFDFNPSYKISERFNYHGRIGTEDIFPHSWYKIYTRNEVSFTIPKFLFKHEKFSEHVYASLQLDYIFYSDQADVFEISPYQGYSLKMPNRKRVVLQHKLELTERFQWAVDDWAYSFGLKLSYEGIFTWKLQGRLLEFGNKFDLSCSFKFWWNLIETTVFNDVARITPGISYTINPKWKAAFMIGYNSTRNSSTDSYSTSSIIYRFRVYYHIPNKKSDSK